MAGLGIFEHDAVAVICLAADDGKAVIIPKLQVFFIYLRHFFHSHDSFACNDGNAQRIFQIFIDGIFSDFRSQGRHDILKKIIVVENQRFIIQIVEPLEIVKL